MDKKKTILIAVTTLILAVIVFSFGYQMGARKEVEVREVPRILGLETSAVIIGQHANAEGEVIEILNQTLILFANGDKLEIPIGERARVITLEPGVDERIMEPREIEFKDLKVGDKVEILIELLPDGLFVGRHIRVLPE